MLSNPIFYKDYYKSSHFLMYPKNTSMVVSNFTPRKSRLPGVNYSQFFGLTYFIKKYLDEQFWDEFFCKDLLGIIYDYKLVMKETLGCTEDFSHIAALHNLGYLPICIKALPENSIVPCGVPALVIYNTLPEFYWLPNMLETILSCTLWGACNSATIAREYRLILDKYAAETSDIPEFVDYQAHDFSMRGMSSLESAIISGAAHLQHFKGTDSIPAVLMLNKYYGRPLQIASVPASEHSIMSAGGKENEFATYKRLITETYPSGILSIVSDTWDLWNVVDNFLPLLKDDIMKRDGKIVIRPDSGDPVDILCGDGTGWVGNCFVRNPLSSEGKGLIARLWEIFGGTINSKGYKQLDTHIGAIYGDSITLERANKICERLKAKGFASTNVVFGVGSFSYQYNTRDVLGWAVKATYAVIDGKGKAITKDPKTDDGTKKSHSGLLKVIQENGTYKVLQNQTWDDFISSENELKTVYLDGETL